MKESSYVLIVVTLILIICILAYYLWERKVEKEKRNIKIDGENTINHGGEKLPAHLHPFKKDERTFGLILRSSVPQSLKAVLNSSPLNGPTVTSIKDLPPIPKEFDCRTKWPGLITGPLNQANCGTCWSFAIATVCSDRARIADSSDKELVKIIEYVDVPSATMVQELNNFSPWILASCNLCDNHPQNSELKLFGLCQTQVCVGQLMQLAMQFVRLNGLTTSECDPRRGECVADFKKCDYQCYIPKECKIYRPELVHQITEDFTSTFSTPFKNFQQYSLMHDGPLVVGITLYKSLMDFFKEKSNAKKVFTYKMLSAVLIDKVISGHAVSLVGWGEEEGTKVPYWLLRNSWGRGWADGGFFRIERGANFLGIGDDVWVSHWNSQNWHKTYFGV